MVEPRLRAQAEEFADEISRLLTGTLPEAPEAEARVRDERLVVQPVADVPLFIAGERRAELGVVLRCQLDHRGEWLAIEVANFNVSAVGIGDEEPIIRFEYVRSPHGLIPGAHVQVHAQRGALSHLLSLTGHQHPGNMSKLHIPVGGARFRPSLEDVIEFLVVECRFDAVSGWRTAVEAAREKWRRTQLKAVVRDMPEDAAEALRRMNYDVTSPTPPPTDSDRALRAW